MLTVTTKTVAVLASKTGLYWDRTSFIAEYLGRKISESRGIEFIETSAVRVLAEHDVWISTAAADRIRDLVLGDTVLDSEARMATRAAERVLLETFGSKMQVSGWIPGRRIARDHDVFILTGDACPRCEVNPLAHGHGGGVRCLNTNECGYWYCG
jgi:hypothetical protein